MVGDSIDPSHRWWAKSFGDGVADTLDRGTSVQGRVRSTFSSGFYVDFGQQPFAIGHGIPDGPLHLVLERPAPSVVEGSAVSVEGSTLLIQGAGLSDAVLRDAAIDLGATPRWTPNIFVSDELAIACSLLMSLTPNQTAVSADLESVWPEVMEHGATCELGRLFHLLEGRGGGLTPTGDDVMAGVLLVESMACPHPAYVESLVRSACSSRTTDLSRAFLRWAARGQSIGPVHSMITHASKGRSAETKLMADRIETIGSTSGAALLTGIAIGAERVANGSDWTGSGA